MPHTHFLSASSLRLPLVIMTLLLSATRPSFAVSPAPALGAQLSGLPPEKQTCLRSFYVDAKRGKDKNNGLSKQSPFKHLRTINQMTLVPGDCILLQGNQIHQGHLTLTDEDAGTPLQPIVISSYGQGRAVISSGDQHGIMVYNTSGVKISDLQVKGSGRLTSMKMGIGFYADLPEGKKLPFIDIRRVEVHGFSEGINISSWNGFTGYKDITIDSCKIHDNLLAGIKMWAEYARPHLAKWPHQNLYIGRCETFNNTGNPKQNLVHSGSGISIGHVDGALIEFSRAYNNGHEDGSPGGGPVGIWAWQSRNVTFQYNHSHHNGRGKLGSDGGGFDFDGGVIDSIMQYNHSNDNEGPGYLIAQYSTAESPVKNVTIRNNVSVNDGLKSGSSLFVWSHPHNQYGIESALIENNIVTVDQKSLNHEILSVSGRHLVKDLIVADNIFKSVNSQVLTIDPDAKLTLKSNLYQCEPCTFTHGGTRYLSEQSWTLATDQEALKAKQQTVR